VDTLPITRPPAAPRRAGATLALALVWSRQEPARVGEVALLPEGAPGAELRLGREAGPDAATLVRQRPGSLEDTGPLTDPRVSRAQLTIRADAEGLQVENVGRCALRHNGREVERVYLAQGDRLLLEGCALFLVVRRPLCLPAFAPGVPAPPPHPFGEPDGDGIVGESPVIWALREAIAFAGPRGAHALINGPSGSGKELVARALHARSPRATRPLVSRSAATFPASLIDAELFGNARDYPNPGMPERPGLIGGADGSTLFLDEIGELPQALQAHLLRVLDDGEFTRLGEVHPRRADLRLVAATNRPDEALKEDLLARLRLRIATPGLGARPEDIPLLARHLLRLVAAEDPGLAQRFFPGGDPGGHPRLGAPLFEALLTRPWRTHARELDGLLWQAMSRSRGDTVRALEAAGLERAKPLPPPGSADPASLTPEAIQAALDRHGGRQEAAWRELGLSSRYALRRLVKKYGLSVRGRG